MSRKCTNCGKSVGSMFGGQLLHPTKIAEFKELIECPDEICTSCDGTFQNAYEKAKLLRQKERLPVVNASEPLEDWSLIEKTKHIPVVSVEFLPSVARYKLIDLICFQSTLGTGLFSEIGSDVSNIFGTEANMLNKKMARSVERCKAGLRVLAFQAGANSVIGSSFVFTTNSKDATTVAAQGTAVFIDNLDEVFSPNKGS